jgi:hypothetical protein
MRGVRAGLSIVNYFDARVCAGAVPPLAIHADGRRRLVK